MIIGTVCRVGKSVGEDDGGCVMGEDVDGCVMGEDVGGCVMGEDVGRDNRLGGSAGMGGLGNKGIGGIGRGFTPPVVCKARFLTRGSGLASSA